MIKKSVCGILKIGDSYLAVSRKDNPNDFGFPGVKVDDGENVQDALIRECIEETGYNIFINNSVTPFVDQCGEFTAYTYLIEISDKTRLLVHPKETGVVKFVSVDDLIAGSFGDYNRKALKYFGYTE